MPGRLKKALLYGPAYVGARLSLALWQALPWNAARALARASGSLAVLFDRRQRQLRALANLQRAFPGMGTAEAKRVLHGVYRHFSEALLNSANFSRLAGRGNAEDLFETEGFEKLSQVPEGLGVIFVTGHFGEFEVLGLASTLLGLPVWSVARDTSNPYIARYVQQMRQRSGQKTLEKGDTWRQIIRLLRRGEHTALLIDQDARRKGIFVDFFGRPASTAPSAGRLAVYTGAPVAFAYSRRIPGQNRFRIVLKDLVLPRADADHAAEVHRITQRLTRDLEEEIRKAPEEWLWLHRRWKTQPGTYERVQKAVVLASALDAPPGASLVDGLVSAGLSRIGVIADADAVREPLAEAARASGAEVEWIEAPRPGGSADALLAAEPFVGTDCFVLVDGACPEGALDKLAASTGRVCLMAAVPGKAEDASVLHVAEDGDIAALLDAPSRAQRYEHEGRLWTDAGLYRLTPDIFDACRRLPPSADGTRGDLRAAIADLLTNAQCRIRPLLCPPPDAG